MKLYLDTGNLEEIRHGLELGVIDGVTTNPSLIAKEGKDFKEEIKNIVKLFKEFKKKNFTVSAEVTKDSVEDMIAQGLQLSKLDPRVVIKVPLTPNGIKATEALSNKGIHVNVTLCFTPEQALLAAKAGAYFISPFVGRLDDLGQDGMQLVRDIRHIYDNYGFTTQILTASVRGVHHVVQAAHAKSDVATIPFHVFEQLFKHPLTDKGLEKFMQDWKQYEEHQ